MLCTYNTTHSIKPSVVKEKCSFFGGLFSSERIVCLVNCEAVKTSKMNNLLSNTSGDYFSKSFLPWIINSVFCNSTKRSVYYWLHLSFTSRYYSLSVSSILKLGLCDVRFMRLEIQLNNKYNSISVHCDMFVLSLVDYTGVNALFLPIGCQTTPNDVPLGNPLSADMLSAIKNLHTCP